MVACREPTVKFEPTARTAVVGPLRPLPFFEGSYTRVIKNIILYDKIKINLAAARMKYAVLYYSRTFQ
jgi:hypothetical protein